MDNLTNYKYTSYHIANTILQIAKARNVNIGLLKLMKLVYIITGYCLSFKFDPFKEAIQAWKRGPVIPSLWHEFKEFSLEKKINRLAYDMNVEGKIITPRIDPKSDDTTDEYAIAIISYVLEKYKNKTGWDLVNKTHKEYTPWRDVYKEGKKHIIIGKDRIKKYYSSFLKNEFEKK